LAAGLCPDRLGELKTLSQTPIWTKNVRLSLSKRDERREREKEKKRGRGRKAENSRPKQKTEKG